MTIKNFKLDNGMQVVLEENHACKVVSFNVLVCVGSSDETGEEAGICHVIEHMMFKGTPTRPTGAIARDVEAAGGEINAYTSIDQTVYYINMATQFADKGLEILADALQNPIFDSDELDREKEVILEEIRRERDNPARMMSEYLFQTAFIRHTYGRPIIGFPETVGSFTHKKLMSFYKKWYCPQNITLIAVGDFFTQEMLEKIKTNFPDKESAPLTRSEQIAEPSQSSPRILIKKMNIQSAYMSIGMHIPQFTHADVPSLDILSHILGGSDSSRLEQEIKEKARLVHNIYAYSFTPKHPGLFVVGAMLEVGKILNVIDAIKKELEKTKHDPVNSDEISRAKLNIRSNQIYEKETVGGQGSKITHFIATAGSHDFESIYYQKLTDVNVDSIRGVADKYLNMANATVVILLPDTTRNEPSKKQIEETLTSKTKVAKKEATTQRPKPQLIKLKNGLRLVLQENHNLPIVSVCATIIGGTHFETQRTNGISSLFSRLVTKGTKTRSAIDISRGIEKLAGHVEGFAGRNTIGLKGEFLSEHLEEGFELFSDILCNPSFAPAEVVKEKKLLLQAIKDQEDALQSAAFSEFLKALFPHHPYGLKVLGSTNSVKALSRANLVSFHKNILRSGNVVLSIVGDINPKEITALATRHYTHFPRSKTKSQKIPLEPKHTEIKRVVVTKREKEQSHIVLGFQGTTIKNPDRFAMHVLNNVLSGQGGRLFSNLRDKQSLAYSVNSINHEGTDPGFFAVYIGTEPKKADTAIKGILKELTQICSHSIGRAELERSKQYLIGTYELDLQRNMALAATYSFDELFGIDLSEIDNYPKHIMGVTTKDVMDAARRYIKPDAYTLAIIRP